MKPDWHCWRTTAPGQSALLLLDAVEVLTREGIRYAVIGAMAASLHGIVGEF